jgi:hypothetical protein
MTTMPSGYEPHPQTHDMQAAGPDAAPTPMSEEQARHEQALRRVKAKRDLSAHVVVYVVVNAFLIGIWWFNGQGYFWPGWVLAGWGIGLVLNVWDVLLRRPITEQDVERELRRM